MSIEPGSVHRFGDFRLDAPSRRLWRGDHQVPLGQKAADALVLLLQRPGELVGKNELIGFLWPDTVVEENNLNQQISALRKALGETAEQPRHIITVPGRGYRFITHPFSAVPATGALARVEPAPAGPEAVHPAKEIARIEGQPHAAPAALQGISWPVLLLMLAVAFSAAALTAWQIKEQRSVPAVPVRSLAVLPLRSLNPAIGDDHFGLGISDAITHNLTAFDIVVRPSGAVRRFAEGPTDPSAAGRALGVDGVLHGTVRRDANDLQVSVQLVRVDNGATVWTERFNTEWRDIFFVQDEIAQRVARALALHLKGPGASASRPPRPTHDPEAYAAYLKSRYFWNKRTADGYLKGIEHAQSAVTRDPGFARAYAAMADCYALLGSSPASPLERADAMNRARQAAERSLTLDASLAEATTSLAFVKMHYDWDWTGAERLFQDALRLDPEYATARHWYAYFLTARGRHEEAIAQIRRALELDPLSVIIASDVGELLLYAGRIDEAQAAAATALELDPAFVQAHRVLAWAAMRRGTYEGALQTLRARSDLSAGAPPELLATTGHLYGLLGRRLEADQIVETLKRQAWGGSEQGIQLSIVYAGLGAKDAAFYWLEDSFRARSGSLILLQVEPLWAPLRDDPRFTALSRRVGLF